MTVQIKPLKGFRNPINSESNTLSLLIKSDYELYEHLSKAKEKLILSLSSILNHFKNSEVNFYHKMQVPSKNGPIYITTRDYKLSLNSPKGIIDDSLKRVFDICHNSFLSHFVNIFVIKNGNTITLNNDNFLELNRIIRDAISNVNKIQYSFADNDPFEKIMTRINKKDRYIDKQSKTVNKRYLSVLKQHMEYLTL